MANPQPSLRLGRAIRRRRQDLDLSASELARRIGASRSYMSYLEKGQFKDIGLDKLCMLLQALGCSADELLQEAGYLAAQPDGLPEPSSYLRQVFGMSAEQARLAIPYLEFIAKRSH